MESSNSKSAEELLRRIQELENGHAHLKQQISKLMNSCDHQKADFQRRNSVMKLTESTFFNILQSIDRPINITDANSCIVYRNRAWEDFYGFSGSETVGKSVMELVIEPKDRPIAKYILQEMLKGDNWTGEFIVRNKKGEKFVIFGSNTTLCDDNGKIIGLVSVSVFPRPYQQIDPFPILDTPKKISSQKLVDFNDQPPFVTNYSLSPKHDQSMLKPRFEWLWKSMNPRQGGDSCSSGSRRFCLHWLHSDQNLPKNILAPKLEAQNNTTITSLGPSSDEIKWNDLKIRECIGRGSCWSVYHAVWDGSDVALKLFPKQAYSNDLMLSFRQEVSLMKRLRHPNILLFMGTVVSPHHLCIVTEFLHRGSLFQLLHRRTRVKLDWKHRVHIAMDIAKGMNYLHHCLPPIIHCNLKSSNLLVAKNWRVKIGDFGTCRIKHETYVTTKEGIGTGTGTAPEVLCNGQADEKSDVYSYGVVLWEITTQEIPLDSMLSKL